MLLRKDTEEFAVLGLGAHAAELLLVAAEAPGVVTFLVTQAAVPVQHLEGNVRVDLLVKSGTLQLCEAAGGEKQRELQWAEVTLQSARLVWVGQK